MGCDLVFCKKIRKQRPPKSFVPSFWMKSTIGFFIGISDPVISFLSCVMQMKSLLQRNSSFTNNNEVLPIIRPYPRRFLNVCNF